MAAELKFVKSDSATAWGFRLVGGSDFDQPLVVVKVNENSLAEAAGLEVGDLIVRINDTPTAGLTHTEAHDLLRSAGLEFVLGIRKSGIPNNIIVDEENNIEVSNILKHSVENDTIQESLQMIDNLNVIDSGQDATNICISENLAGQEQIICTSTVQNKTVSKKDKKWSTFLMKPNKPVPKPKNHVEEDKIKEEPYRVIIKKQPRRSLREKKVQFDKNVTEVEIEKEDVEETKEIEEIHGEVEISGHGQLESLEVEVNITETEETVIEETEVNDESDNSSEQEFDAEPLISRNSYEMVDKTLSNVQIDSTSESSLSLEEQLLAVQKQLQALSQLPSAIQVTLNAVSKQLATIVSAKQNLQETQEDKEETYSPYKEEDEPVTEEEYLEESLSEKAEAEINEEDLREEDSSSIGEELEEDVTGDEVIEEGEKENDEVQKENQKQDPYYGLTEEEKEAKIKEEQLMAKQQKVEHWNSIWPWSDKVKPIYSINFLKYQPPPKNLDYLQRSEVYRLVHDMEPPVRGITTRAEKILSEQDYYEATKGAP